MGVVIGERTRLGSGWLRPLVEAGLAAGERVIVLTDREGQPRAPAGGLADPASHDRLAVLEGRLVVVSARELLIRGGRFDGGLALSYLDAEIEIARATGYTGVRVISDLAWALDRVDNWRDLVTYEERLHALAKGRAATLVCHFDRHVLDGACLAALLRAHPRWLASAGAQSGVERGAPPAVVPRRAGEWTTLAAATAVLGANRIWHRLPREERLVDTALAASPDVEPEPLTLNASGWDLLPYWTQAAAAG
jgi:hypothetical protein